MVVVVQPRVLFIVPDRVYARWQAPVATYVWWRFVGYCFVIGVPSVLHCRCFAEVISIGIQGEAWWL